MSSESHYRFDDFYVDVENRQLRHDGKQIELNARYFDALILLVQNQGQLVEKDQFFSEVWDDVIVSDSALTQCIKSIRKQLGDDAANPRYVQTVPGYGYRFIGSVKTNPSKETLQDEEGLSGNNSSAASVLVNEYSKFHRILLDGGVGTLGGMVAGLVGGLFYGFGLIYAPGDPGMGAISMLLVLMGLNVVIGGLGGLGVSFGMATAKISTGNKIWTVIGATFGGLLVGGLTKLLGVDAFNILFGNAPDGITGGAEGAVLGAALGLGTTFGVDPHTKRPFRPVVAAALACGIAGVLISMAGGRLMGGSLDLFTHSFANSQLQLDALGHYFGEMHFGFITQTVLAGIEGLLFGGGVAGAMVYGRQALSKRERI